MYNGCKFSSPPAMNVKHWFMERFSLYSEDFSIHSLLFPSFVFALTKTAPICSVAFSADINQGDRCLYAIICLLFQRKLGNKFSIDYDYNDVEAVRSLS